MGKIINREEINVDQNFQGELQYKLKYQRFYVSIPATVKKSLNACKLLYKNSVLALIILDKSSESNLSTEQVNLMSVERIKE